jgi:leukotriene-A4 hydrolase
LIISPIAQPYVFSQCEDANCRSLIPLQDTPAVKHTYSANILTRPEIAVFMSGNQTTLNQFSLMQDYPELLRDNPKTQWKVSSFETTIPFQSYLIAIIAGDVVQKQVGPRSYVISEPIYIDAYAQELSDLESYLIDIENYIGPYM